MALYILLSIFFSPTSATMSKKCAVKGCGEKFYAKTYCYYHYSRNKRTGRPGPPRRKFNNYVRGDTGYIEMSNGGYAICSECDFDFLSQYGWHTSKGYPRAYLNGKHMRMHEAIGCKRHDHINRNPLDNRRENLRKCTRSQNVWNTGPKPGTSRYKGVHYKEPNKKWQAQITYKYKKIYIGVYDREKDAAKAYDLMALRLFGEFAYLNFPESKKPWKKFKKLFSPLFS